MSRRTWARSVVQQSPSPDGNQRARSLPISSIRLRATFDKEKSWFSCFSLSLSLSLSVCVCVWVGFD